MTDDTEDLKAQLRAARRGVDVDGLVEQFRDELRQAKTIYDTAVAQATSRRTDLLKRAAHSGLSYYKIAQLTRTDGADYGYGQEFIRKVCQSPDVPATGVSQSGGSVDPPAVV